LFEVQSLLRKTKYDAVIGKAQMHTSLLVNLIDSSVMDFDGDGLNDLVPELLTHLPTLLKSNSVSEFDLLLKASRLVAFAPKAEPVALVVKLLLDVGFASSSRARTHEGLPLVERAIDLSQEHGLKPELRRSFSVYSALSTDVGFPARGVECALKANAISVEMGFVLGEAAAQANITAALYIMGLYRECIEVSARLIDRFGNDAACTEFVAIARMNFSSSAIALQEFQLGADTSRKAVESLNPPRDSSGIVLRIISESNWLKCLIGLNEKQTAAKRLKNIKALAEAFNTPRTELNRQLAEAAYEIFDGDLTIAVAKLLKLLETSKALPALYRDNLALLVRAYEKAHDHTGVLIYLGKLVEFLAKSQVDNVKRALDGLKVKVQTPMPGKDDVQDLIAAIQRDGQLPRKDVDVPEPMYRDAYERLAVTAELREDTWGKHSYRVGRLTYLLAQELGYGHRFCEEIELAARLHDIGKLGIPDGLLLKPGKLTPAEFAIIQRHTSIGAQLLSLCPNPAFRMAEVIAMGHHEKWDGSGYPNALAGDAIPEAARIAALADVYDALTHVRAYKHAWTHAEAIGYILSASGTHFEPRMVDAFVRIVEKKRTKYGKKFEEYLAAPSSVSTLVKARREMQDMLDAMYRIDEEVARQQREAAHDPMLEIPQRLATEEEQNAAKKSAE
jgi:putative two-component system response regulator